MMNDIDFYEVFKDKPKTYNNMVAGYFRNVIIEYFTEKKLPVQITDGDVGYIRIIYESHPENALNDITTFYAKDINTHKDVCIDMKKFESGEQYLYGKSYAYKCESCGDYLNTLLYNDKIVLSHIKDKECFKLQDYNIKFTVPANGKMAINDWLGDILSEPSENISVNSEKGKFLTTKDAESKGFVHFFVGNTCPSVFKLQDGTIIISSSHALCTEESDYEEVDQTKYPGAEKIGWVCTDLWWVTMASEDHCLELESKGNEYRTGDIIELESGEWECTVHISGDYDEDGIFATMKKVK